MFSIIHPPIRVVLPHSYLNSDHVILDTLNLGSASASINDFVILYSTHHRYYHSNDVTFKYLGQFGNARSHFPDLEIDQVHALLPRQCRSQPFRENSTRFNAAGLMAVESTGPTSLHRWLRLHSFVTHQILHPHGYNHFLPSSLVD